MNPSKTMFSLRYDDHTGMDHRGRGGDHRPVLSRNVDQKSRKVVRPATFYVARGAADIRWRVELPVRHLKAKLVSMNLKQAEREINTPHDGGKFPWSLTEEGAVYPEHEGTAVWVRPDMKRAVHAAAMKANGVRTVAEIDDNYLSDPALNYFMRDKYGDEARRRHMRAFASFDAIIASTRWLRDEYAKTFKKELGYVPEMFVARNHVDPEDWLHRKDLLPPGRRLRVGWAGSEQHLWDIRLAAPALRLAVDMGCEVVFVGLDPATKDPNWRSFLTEYLHIPWQHPTDYHKTRLNFDIALIPLVMNKHTLGKSDVKALEFGMSGAAIVAQNNSVYNRSLKHNETALLSGSPDEMALATRELILNHRLRFELATAMKQYILEERTIQGNIHEWREAI